MKTKIRRKNSTNVYEILKTRGVNYDLLFTLDENDKRNPFDFTDMEKAIDLIHKAYTGDKKICYIVDTDVDGTTSFSIAYNYFHSLYPNKSVDYFMNSGKRHGAFLEEPKLQQLEEGDTVIIFDAAENDWGEIDYLLKKGVNVVVGGHHEISVPLNQRIKE